eukprot:scaffold671629_cov42-Prasinocladus_malaysianus.AAC.1
MFTCPSREQVYDLAMSSPGGRIYVIAQVALPLISFCRTIRGFPTDRLHNIAWRQAIQRTLGSHWGVIGQMCHQESLYVFAESGSPICAMTMSDWPGVTTNPLFMQVCPAPSVLCNTPHQSNDPS